MVEKLAPVMAAEFTVTGVVPVDLRVMDSIVAVLTAILPKLRVVELTVNCGLATVPVPLSATAVVLPLEELLLIVSFPVTAPVAAGLNCTWSVTDCCGFKVAGRLPPTMVKPVPAIAAEFTVTAEVPVEVSTKDSALAVFTVTL